ncbi:MAG: UDP-N-acetylmuramate dehydrogenase [Pseudomonadota bacterium]
MLIEKHVNLKPYNTFAVNISTDAMIRLDSYATVTKISAEIRAANKLLVLGGGSNILFLNNFAGLILKNEFKGIELIRETEKEVLLRIGAGEIWHRLVCYCVEKGYVGIENLSLIPGTVGAAPIQNIGAYGVELCQVFESLEAIDLTTFNRETFYLADCQFGYRDSVFKQRYKDRFLITYVHLKLSKLPNYNLSYPALEAKLAECSAIDLKSIAQAVIEIRQAKLPDPQQVPNAGSFFKNPIVTKEHFYSLSASFTNLPCFKVNETAVKIPAAWLIEQCGFKGKRYLHAGVHDKQALVLINVNNAPGTEIYNLAKTIRQQVLEKFAIELEYEVNVI